MAEFVCILSSPAALPPLDHLANPLHSTQTSAPPITMPPLRRHRAHLNLLPIFNRPTVPMPARPPPPPPAVAVPQSPPKPINPLCQAQGPITIKPKYELKLNLSAANDNPSLTASQRHSYRPGGFGKLVLLSVKRRMPVRLPPEFLLPHPKGEDQEDCPAPKKRKLC